MAVRPKHIKFGVVNRFKRLASSVTVKPKVRPIHLRPNMTVRPTTLGFMPDQHA